MAVQITTAMKNQYRDTIEQAVQQVNSRLSGTVGIEMLEGENTFIDRVGVTDMVEKTGRNEDTPIISTPHDRRAISFKDFVWADLVDKEDELRKIGDVKSAYMQAAMAAANRTKDKEILKAMIGTSFAGKYGEVSVPYSTTNDVAVDFVWSGSPVNSGLTVPKLLRARTNILKRNVDLAEEKLYLVVNAKALEDLLNSTQVGSADYNSIKPLVDGTVKTFAGFEFIHSEMLKDIPGYIDGSNMYLPFYTSKAIKLGIANDIETRIDPRPDKNYATQLYMKMSIGAARMWEERIGRITIVA